MKPLQNPTNNLAAIKNILERQEISFDDMDVLESNLKNLSILNLLNCNISTSGIEILPMVFTKNQSLEILFVDLKKFNDAQILLLASSFLHTNIKQIIFPENTDSKKKQRFIDFINIVKQLGNQKFQSLNVGPDNQIMVLNQSIRTDKKISQKQLPDLLKLMLVVKHVMIGDVSDKDYNAIDEVCRKFSDFMQAGNKNNDEISLDDFFKTEFDFSKLPFLFLSVAVLHNFSQEDLGAILPKLAKNQTQQGLDEICTETLMYLIDIGAPKELIKNFWGMVFEKVSKKNQQNFDRMAISVLMYFSEDSQSQHRLEYAIEAFKHYYTNTQQAPDASQTLDVVSIALRFLRINNEDPQLESSKKVRKLLRASYAIFPQEQDQILIITNSLFFSFSGKDKQFEYLVGDVVSFLRNKPEDIINISCNFFSLLALRNFEKKPMVMAINLFKKYSNFDDSVIENMLILALLVLAKDGGTQNQIINLFEIVSDHFKNNQLLIRRNIVKALADEKGLGLTKEQINLLKNAMNKKGAKEDILTEDLEAQVKVEEELFAEADAKRESLFNKQKAEKEAIIRLRQKKAEKLNADRQENLKESEPKPNPDVVEQLSAAEKFCQNRIFLKVNSKSKYRNLFPFFSEVKMFEEFCEQRKITREDDYIAMSQSLVTIFGASPTRENLFLSESLGFSLNPQMKKLDDLFENRWCILSGDENDTIKILILLNFSLAKAKHLNILANRKDYNVIKKAKAGFNTINGFVHADISMDDYRNHEMIMNEYEKVCKKIDSLLQKLNDKIGTQEFAGWDYLHEYSASFSAYEETVQKFAHQWTLRQQLDEDFRTRGEEKGFPASKDGFPSNVAQVNKRKFQEVARKGKIQYGKSLASLTKKITKNPPQYPKQQPEVSLIATPPQIQEESKPQDPTVLQQRPTSQRQNSWFDSYVENQLQKDRQQNLEQKIVRQINPEALQKSPVFYLLPSQLVAAETVVNAGRGDDFDIFEQRFLSKGYNPQKDQWVGCLANTSADHWNVNWYQFDGKVWQKRESDLCRPDNACGAHALVYSLLKHAEGGIYGFSFGEYQALLSAMKSTQLAKDKLEEKLNKQTEDYAKNPQYKNAQQAFKKSSEALMEYSINFVSVVLGRGKKLADLGTEDLNALTLEERNLIGKLKSLQIAIKKNESPEKHWLAIEDFETVFESFGKTFHSIDDLNDQATKQERFKQKKQNLVNGLKNPEREDIDRKRLAKFLLENNVSDEDTKNGLIPLFQDLPESDFDLLCGQILSLKSEPQTTVDVKQETGSNSQESLERLENVTARVQTSNKSTEESKTQEIKSTSDLLKQAQALFLRFVDELSLVRKTDSKLLPQDEDLSVNDVIAFDLEILEIIKTNKMQSNYDHQIEHFINELNLLSVNLEDLINKADNPTGEEDFEKWAKQLSEQASEITIHCLDLATLCFANDAPKLSGSARALSMSLKQEFDHVQYYSPIVETLPIEENTRVVKHQTTNQHFISGEEPLKIAKKERSKSPDEREPSSIPLRRTKSAPSLLKNLLENNGRQAT